MTESWYLAEVHPNREAAVAFTMRCLDIEPFIPLMLQTERISMRTKQRELSAKPVIMGYVFFRTAPDFLSSVNAIRDLKGIFQDGFGNYVTIPPRQMVPFIANNEAWVAEARERHRRGRKINAGPKPKFRKMTEEALKEWIARYHGPEMDGMQEAA